MASGTSNLLQMLETRVRDLCDKQKWDEAVHTAETAVQKAREVGDTQPEIVGELALSLELKADLLRQLGRTDEARFDYTEALELLDGREEYTEQIGRVNASLAVVCDQESDLDGAKRHYEAAIKIFEEMDPPASLDIADLSNNLAFVYEAEEDYDKAEDLFLQALKISHDMLGKNNTETASICNNLGALYQRTEHFDRAKEMHMMALEARTEELGKDHPDTGQSHANLAVALVESQSYDAARKHFEQAVTVYEKHMNDAPEDYETVASNYSQFLKAIGDEKGAVQVAKRSMKMLKKLLKR